MLGVSIASRRTKMIVIEAGTLVAYDYLQNLPGLEHFLEYTQIMLEFVAGYRFLWEHRGSWRGGYRDVLLRAKDKQLCIGGLGRIDGQWEDSGWRMNEAFWRLSDGRDLSGGGNVSFEQNADLFERMRESVTEWNEENTEESARDLFDWLDWWSGSSKRERGTENSPTVGEIQWRDGNEWHPIPLVHQFPLAQPQKYSITASRWREGEWETIVGARIEGFTRWSIDVSPGEEIYLLTFVRSYRTKDIADFFYGSALSLARDSGVDVRSVRIVSRAGFDVDASLTIFHESPSIVYYFTHPPYSEGSVPDTPGFWSSCPYPRCSDCRLQADAAQVEFHLKPFVQYESIDNHFRSLLRDLESHGFLPIPDITYASNPPFASLTEVSENATESTIKKQSKKRLGDALLAAFSKKRKTS
ncbi:hypothetical protein SISNIDRAFT_491820 [Sistotremastrum niveocremeum HHB9708]|uniref:Uncharacterized protein n=1 Tax=Sistotremastrum niveocremeum HHB9708 TaxID=1314777 RepID=A0A164MCP3_9AGAM|nr:hypothetical protein SISNIDRAFT_491820 [Sistotremastrum niveocremeum HHB9708]